MNAKPTNFSAPITVLPVADVNFESLVQLYHRYLLYFGHKRDASVLRIFLSKILSKDFSYCLVAKADEDTIGFCAGVYSYSPVALGLALTINDLYVDDPWRRKNVGRILIKTLESYANQRGANTLFVNTDANIPWLTPYYEQIGFFAINHRTLVKRLNKESQ
ncbi:MAG: TDP-fucosamine acetyltransferase [Verrucomicrobiales bacterium]|nr:TDP-fucosamine acetyltransferase [Verrucomicrobiales bacterium]